MMSKVLVTIDIDWADEFSVYGFKLFNKQEWNLLYDKLKIYGDTEVSWYFGTNEGWDEPIKYFLDNMKVKEIDDIEVHVLSKRFGAGFGNFPPLEEWVLGIGIEWPLVIEHTLYDSKFWEDYTDGDIQGLSYEDAMDIPALSNIRCLVEELRLTIKIYESGERFITEVAGIKLEKVIAL